MTIFRYVRGAQAMQAQMCVQINGILDGEMPTGAADEPWHSARLRLAALVPKQMRRYRPEVNRRIADDIAKAAARREANKAWLTPRRTTT